MPFTDPTLREVEILEAALRSSPEDSAAWLEYAQWLLQQGDPRGELVQLEHQGLSAEAEALLERHRPSWTDGWYDPQAVTPRWRHGFVCEAHFRGRNSGDVFARLVEHPVSRLLGSVSFGPLRGRAGRRVVDALARTRIWRLSISGGLDKGFFSALADADLASLRALDLRDCGVDGPSVGLLVSAPGLGGLTSLSLAANHVGDEGAKALASSELALTTLNLHDNQLGDRGALAFADSGGPHGLRALRLDTNKLTPLGISALAHSSKLGALRVLDLGCNVIEARGAAALAASEGLSELRSLGLRFSRLGDAGAMALAATRTLRNLETLDLAANRLSDTAAFGLARSDALRSLRALNLTDNSIGPAGAEALKQAGIPALR